MINNSFNFLVLFNSMRKIITICFAALQMLSISFRMNFFFIFKKNNEYVNFHSKKKLKKEVSIFVGTFYFKLF